MPHEVQAPPLEDGACWLGLATDNRRLFDALQDGWLRPHPSQGHVVGIRAYTVDSKQTNAGHPIRVRVKFDPAKLPELGTQILHNNGWRPSCVKKLQPKDEALYWPGALPTFAISELSVSTEEERARFIGMTEIASNLVLPEVPIMVGIKPDELLEVGISPPHVEAEIGIPSDIDPTQGAIAMAVWGVPRIDPWLDILAASLDPKQPDMMDLASKVDAPWWRFPPWIMAQDDVNSENFHIHLWLAATKVFRCRTRGERINPELLSQQIYNMASQGDSAEGLKHELSKWLEKTNDILRAGSLIHLQNWRHCPVGIAIQLVLTRPEPSNFKTWFKDIPQLPPAIAWSAAVLCGLLHGYRRLDCQFRGDALQSELLSIHALRLCTEGGREIHWPSVTDRKPGWRRTTDGIILSWDGHDFSTKTEHARGHWFNANFKDTTVETEAKKLATDLNWPCFVQELILKDIELAYSGGGALSRFNTYETQRQAV